MGLNHPTDLQAWSRWQRTRSPLREIRARIMGNPEAAPVVAVRGSAPRTLIALDSAKPTSMASLVRPLDYLATMSAAVVAPQDVREHLPGGPWHLIPVQDRTLPEALTGIRVIAAGGHYMPVGSLAHDWAKQLGAHFCVVQHGLMTPHAPPLPGDAHLLAFSDADADFWRSGRTDVTTHVVGSQLFWDAQDRPVTEFDADAPPVFLGQLHGAELPRRGLARAATHFCSSTGAVYRPHPSETDRLSRLQHALWERHGVKVERSGISLAELASPIVSVFSTGVLESAARGIPAWVTYPSPPAWLEEFWERYGMSQWGQEPTLSPARMETEPAKVIARLIEHHIGGH